AASLLLLCGLSASAQPFTAPGGPWDVVMTGTRDGVAQMTFLDDGTISMSEVLVPKSPGASGHAADDSRGTGGDESRGGTLPPPPAAPPHTNLDGFVGSPSTELNFTN